MCAKNQLIAKASESRNERGGLQCYKREMEKGERKVKKNESFPFIQQQKEWHQNIAWSHWLLNESEKEKYIGIGWR